MRILDEGGTDRGHVTLVQARAGGIARSAPGMVEGDGLIAAGGGTGVELVQIQPEGKRPMPLAAYCNGHAWGAGMRLESL